jgi:hypothetical protein
VEGKYKHNSQVFTSHLFVRKIDQYAPVENFAALSAIRVPNSKTERRPDLISLNRSEIRIKALQLAKLHAGKQPVYFKRTPKVSEAISIFSSQVKNEFYLDLALDKVQTKQTLKRAKQIVKLINREYAMFGLLTKQTLGTVEGFIRHMSSFDDIELEVRSDSLEGVLYFAS